MSAIDGAARTFGSVVRAHHWPGLSVDEVLMPRGLHAPEHHHEGAQLYFLLEGRYSEEIEHHDHALAPGATWFRAAAVPHANAVLGDDPALTLIVTAQPDRLRWVERRSPAARPLPALLLADLRGELIAELRRADAASHTALEGWALLLLSRVERALVGSDEERPARWLDEAVSFVSRAYAEPITLESVAAHVGVHPGTLAAGFRRHLRISVGEHIREVRLRAARRAVLDSRTPLKQIAGACGFFDQAHMGRWFRRAFGVSPAALRRQTR